MIFEEALKAVRSKEAIAFRNSWEGDKFIFCQIPTTISANIIPNMQSLPDIVKTNILEEGYCAIHYINQICIFENGNITYYIPNGEDMFATDWKIISNTIPC